MCSLPERDLLALILYLAPAHGLGLWHAWVYGEEVGRYGSMASARFSAKAQLGERVHWERLANGDRWEAWSHRL